MVIKRIHCWYTFCCLLLTVQLYAQADTAYFTADGQWAIKGSSRAWYYRVAIALPDSGYSVKEYFNSNNQLKSSGRYTAPDTGKKDGNFITYNVRGVKLSEGKYSNGKAVGLHKSYRDSSGKLWITEAFNNEGQHDGLMMVYYENGSVRRKEMFKNDKSVSADCYNEKGKKVAYFPFQTLPEFPGGTTGLATYLSANVHYPETCRQANIEGRVFASFMVLATGDILFQRIISSPSVEFNREVIRVIHSMPKWKPGMQDGKKMNCYFTLPVTFRLE